MTARIRESEINTTVIEAGVRQKNSAVCWLYFTNLVRKIRSKSAFLWQKTAHVLELIYSRVHRHWTNWHPEANQATDVRIPQLWFNYHLQSKTFSLQLLHYLTGGKKEIQNMLFSMFHSQQRLCAWKQLGVTFPTLSSSFHTSLCLTHTNGWHVFTIVPVSLSLSQRQSNARLETNPSKATSCLSACHQGPT